MPLAKLTQNLVSVQNAIVRQFQVLACSQQAHCQIHKQLGEEIHIIK